MKRILTITILSSLMILVIGSTISAQGHFKRGFGGPDKMGMHKKNLENLRLLKLLEVLDLEEDQNDQFISAFSKFRKNSKAIKEKVEGEVTSLGEYLKQDNRSDNVILEKVDLIVSMKEEFELERKNFFERVKDILTPEQLGRMMVFQERFERELLEQVRGFRAPKPPDGFDSMSVPSPKPEPNFPGIDD